MKNVLLWGVLGSLYVGLAWWATTTLIWEVLFQVVFSAFGLVFLPYVLTILVLCPIGIHGIRKRMNGNTQS